MHMRAKALKLSPLSVAASAAASLRLLGMRMVMAVSRHRLGIHVALSCSAPESTSSVNFIDLSRTVRFAIQTIIISTTNPSNDKEDEHG